MQEMKLKIITQSKAKTGTYGEISLNLGVGCTHGCFYCYGPVTVYKPKDAFHGAMVLKSDIESKLISDCKELQKADFTGRVLLCHVTDPYQPCEMDQCITRRAMEILREHDIHFQVLTKGGTRACRDFDLYTAGDSFAETLITTDEKKINLYEPGAAPPLNRIEALRKAKGLGIDTWVSMEPVIWTEDIYEVIKATHEYAGHYKIGPINHFPDIQRKIDWREFASEVSDLLKGLNKEFYFNKSMQKLLGKP